MANIQWKFYCPAGGGGYANYIIPSGDMGNYPYAPEELFNRNTKRAQTGKLWSYEAYNIKKHVLHFADVGGNTIATLGSIARSGTEFLFIDDVYNSGGTGTYFYTGDTWNPQETQDGLWTVDFQMEQID